MKPAERAKTAKAPLKRQEQTAAEAPEPWIPRADLGASAPISKGQNSVTKPRPTPIGAATPWPRDVLKTAVAYDDRLRIWTVSSELSALDNINPALTRYGRKEPAPVLPLREEPDLLSWLETSGRLVEDEESSSPEVSTVEEEELSALMGEKEEYNAADEQTEENWED